MSKKENISSVPTGPRGRRLLVPLNVVQNKINEYGLPLSTFNRFLDGHRIVWMSNSGMDGSKNYLTLCRGCHKRFTLVKSQLYPAKKLFPKQALSVNICK